MKFIDNIKSALFKYLVDKSDVYIDFGYVPGNIAVAIRVRAEFSPTTEYSSEFYPLPAPMVRLDPANGPDILAIIDKQLEGGNNDKPTVQ